MDTMVDYTSFDLTQPREVGAVAFAPYSGPELSQQRPILPYTGAHSRIHALGNPRVVENYDDVWANAHIGLTYYGHLREVSSSADAALLVNTTATIVPTY